MDLYLTLTIMTIAGALTSGVAGALSQIWKSSTEVEGKIKKRLTPVGWLSLGIALVGLLTSVASILIRVSLTNNEQLQAKTEAAQKRALQEQEQRWRSDMTTILKITQEDIEKNLGNTIAGFQDSQTRFSRTQAEIVSSKQSVLESNLHHTNEIIVAGQPLTSLAFSWWFDSASPQLWQTMKDGEEEINENNESVRGGVPSVPYETMEYHEALIPLLSYVARIGTDQTATDDGDSRQVSDTTIVLLPLDESQNCILSFGRIASDITWRGGKDDKGGPSISAGFLTSHGFAVGESVPSVITRLATNNRRGLSSYAVGWELDPATLANTIQCRNPSIKPTAKLPKMLKVAIFYGVQSLPFQYNNFAVPTARNLWRYNETTRQNILFGRELKNATFSIQVNDVRQMKYVLKRMYSVGLIDENEDEIDTSCTILEFEAV